jgi:hypothetical protein
MTGLDGEILEPDHMAGQNTRGADEASVRAGFWRTFAKAAKQVPLRRRCGGSLLLCA